MTEAEAVAAITRMIHALSDGPVEVFTDTRFEEDLNLDSLTRVELALKVEREFSVEIPDEALPTLTSVDAVIAFLREAKAVA